MEKVNKKVLFTSHTANFQKFNRPFMRMLKQQGYIIHYASAGEEKVSDTDRHFNVPFERNPLKLGNIKAYFKLKKIINDEKYDFIHTHTPMGSVITRLAAIRSRKHGTRVIYTAHGFHFFKGAPIANWLVYYPIEKFMARFTDTLITINKEDYERATKSFKTDVRYVPGVGIDEARFSIMMSKDTRRKLRESLNLEESAFIMIYVAELSERKNQLWLIQSLAGYIKSNPDVQLLLVGNDNLASKCQKLVEKLQLDSQIHFLGYRSDIPELMKMSDLAISSSKQEGLPVNVMEAMQLGLPVIVTDCRGNRDLIVDELNGYVVALNDEENLVSKILQLKNNKALITRISANNKKESHSFSLPKIEAVMQGIYYEGISDV